MTEQEQIEAIESLCSLLPWKLKGKPWHACNTQEKETLRDAAIQALRTMHGENSLNARDVYEFLVHGRWEDTTEQDKLICATAVVAMEEVIKSEL
jgi:hypothetical protein